jgi:hypothetical protein
MPNLPLLNTPGFEWREPGETNPRGYLAGDPRVHPAGGVVVRDDDLGQGMAVNLLGSPLPRLWPTGVPVIGMPLQTDDAGHLWAPPYPQMVHYADELPGVSAGAPSGDEGDVAEITAPLTIAIVNTSAYDLVVAKRVIVRDARMKSPRKPVSYGVMINGVPYPLFTGAPSFETSVIETEGTVTVDTVPHTFLTGVSVVNAIVPTEHCYSGSLDLPSTIVAPGASLSLDVTTAVMFQQDNTDPFEVRVGHLTVELFGFGLVDYTFGEDA